MYSKKKVIFYTIFILILLSEKISLKNQSFFIEKKYTITIPYITKVVLLIF